MAEETVVAAAAPAAPVEEEVVVVSDVSETKGKGGDVAPPTAEEVEIEKPKEVESTEKTKEQSPIAQSVSFKEESNIVADLKDSEKKALDDFKALIQDAMNKHEFATIPPPPPPPPAKEEEKPATATAAAVEEVKEEEKTDVVPTTSTEAEEKPSAEEATKSETPAEAKAEASTVVVVEEVKVEVKEDVKEEVKEPTPAPVAVVEEDGTRTVEAIEETIVSSVPKEEAAAASEAGTSSDPVPESKEKAAPELPVVEEEQVPPPPPEEVSIFGIPLLADERSNTILLKFLRARDFKVKEAFTMIRNTVRWRKEFGIDELVDEDLGVDYLDKVVFMNGFDKEGHPVCYNVYGEFQNKELYQKTFSDEEKSQKFLKWRIQFLERSIRKLDFTPGGICTIVQVNDLRNSPGPFKTLLRQATNQALALLQDNYPEFVARQVFINVPWWYLAFNRMISPFLTQRTKSKFVFAGPSKSAETLFKYINPEQVPIQYGGLSKEAEEFTTTDAVTEITIKPATKQTVEFPVSETCTLVWEVRVVGWDVTYGAEFVPSAEDGYTVIVQKARKVHPSEEPVICNSFKIGEPGKVILTIDNTTSKKKKLLYRSKTKPSSD